LKKNTRPSYKVQYKHVIAIAINFPDINRKIRIYSTWSKTYLR